jgi:hypothetical protein
MRSKRELEMFTRGASVCTLFIVLMCSANAHVDETWTCIRKYENGQQFSSEVIIAGDQLTFKGGKGGYAVFDNNNDHVLAANVFKNKGDIITDYVLIERMSGVMTEFSDVLQIAFKGADGNVTTPPSHSDCTRKN